MVRKCRRAGVADIAVMEVAQVSGVRKQAAGAEAMAAATTTARATAKLTKKRKLNGEDLTLSSSCNQLRNRKIAVEDNGSKTVSDGRNWNPNLDRDRDRVSTSCCSSNGSSEEVNERINFVDLEDESVEVETSTYYSCRERRETTASASSLEAAEESDDLDSKAKCCSSEANSHRRSTVEKMPTESEINEFFAEAEKQLLKQYSEKYNFDFVQEKPTEGRYEWVRLKP